LLDKEEGDDKSGGNQGKSAAAMRSQRRFLRNYRSKRQKNPAEKEIEEKDIASILGKI